MVIADTYGALKDKEPKVTTTCDDCHYNVYRMLGEEAQKLRKPDDCGEHYYPFSQNGKVVQIATYIQTAYRDGYKHGYKDGYKCGFDDGYREGKQDVELTQGYAISLLRESGWLDKYGEECIRKAILNRHLMTPEEAKDEFNFEQGKLEGRLEVLTSIKDLCILLESEESWESDACDGCCRANSNFDSKHMSAVLKDLYDSLESEEQA